MAGKRSNVTVLDDSFMEFGTCRKRKREVVETSDGPVEVERPIVDPRCFFSEDGRSLADRFRTVEARVACWMCPVKPECLEFALAGRFEHGVWGGHLPDERLVILSRRAGNRRRVPVPA